MIKDLKVTKGTVVRTILTAIVLVNIVLKAVGMKPIDIEEGTISSVVECVVSIAILGVSFWKNNSYSTAAKNADFALAKLKNFDSDEADDVFDEGE